MTSTRNKNTNGNYQLEQQQFRRINEHINYIHSYNGPPHSVSIPGGGIAPPSRMNRDSLSENSIDIESSLLGIGSTNLVKHKPKVVPKLNDLSTTTFLLDQP